MQRQQMAQRIDRHMQVQVQVHLAAFAPFGAVIVIACALATLGRRLQRATVEDGRDGRRRLRLPPGCQPQQRSQVVHQRLEHPCVQPALRSFRRIWGIIQAGQKRGYS